MSEDAATVPATEVASKAPTASDVYDRQIRLWGADAQAKMMKAKVLYIHVTGVTSEVMKNCVLAGIAATICDTRSVSALAETPSFLAPPNTELMTTTEGDSSNKKLKYSTVAEAVQPVVDELNPLLGSCPILAKSVSDLTADDVKDFTVVMASRIGPADASRISGYVTANKAHFILTDSFGWNGAAILDYGPNLMFRPEQGKQLLDPKPLQPYLPLGDILKVPLHKAVNRFFKKSPPSAYVQYRCILEYIQQHKAGKWDETVQDTDDSEEWHKLLLKYVNGTGGGDEEGAKALGITKEVCQEWSRVYTAEIAPVCAVLGGMLGNEVIKIISGKGEPANNTILVDGALCKAWTYLVQEKV